VDTGGKEIKGQRDRYSVPVGTPYLSLFINLVIFCFIACLINILEVIIIVYKKEKEQEL
jgi:hypothetical protein